MLSYSYTEVIDSNLFDLKTATCQVRKQRVKFRIEVRSYPGLNL